MSSTDQHADRTATPSDGGSSGSFDGASGVTAYVSLLLILPASMKIAPLRGFGSPSMLVGLGLVVWWAYSVLQRRSSNAPRHPMTVAYLAVLGTTAVSFVAAMSRPINPAETNAAVVTMIGMLAWGGALLTAMSGIPDRERFVVLQRRLVTIGGALALLGLVQFFTGDLWINRISIPGLTNFQVDASVATRDGFNRPSATAIHPIEFGYIITIILPMALNLALADKGRPWLRRWAPTGLILFAVSTSVSRSALLCAVVGVVTAAVVWPRRVRRVAVLVTPFLLVGVFVAVPGLLGTMLGLFTGISDDSSAQSRTGSYSVAAQYIAQSPFVGRGFGTFLPTYRILDNGWLLLLIEVGFLGLAAMLGLVLTGMWCARQARLTGDPRDALLGQGLVGSLASGAVGLALFDGLSFPMASGLLFVVIGMAGGFFGLTRAGRTITGHRAGPGA